METHSSVLSRQKNTDFTKKIYNRIFSAFSQTLHPKTFVSYRDIIS